MEHDIILRREDAHRLNVVLTKLVDKGRIDCVLLINKSGRLLTSQSESNEFDKSSLAALVAGSFASTTAVAQMLGEEEFTALFHQGKKKSTYISMVDANTILMVLFDKRTTLDKVKHFVKELGPELQTALDMLYGSMSLDPNINIDGARGSPKT